MHSLVFVPFVSRRALLHMAGDAEEGSDRDPRTLASKELDFNERLGASDDGDLLLAEWQLALTLHRYSMGAYKNACQHVLPLFFGAEEFADVFRYVVRVACAPSLGLIAHACGPWLVMAHMQM